MDTCYCIQLCDNLVMKFSYLRAVCGPADNRFVVRAKGSHDRASPRPAIAALFLAAWPLRPTDMLVRKEYRELLLELEREGTIAVFDSKTGIEKPAAKRPRNTLAEHF